MRNEHMNFILTLYSKSVFFLFHVIKHQSENISEHRVSGLPPQTC